MRQTAEGRIVAGSDFGGTEPGADPVETARALFAEVQAMLKGGDALKLDFHTLGYRPTPSDGFPIIGRAAGVDGLYVAVMHSGITLAPVVGLFATQELTTGRRDPLLAPYGLVAFCSIARGPPEAAGQRRQRLLRPPATAIPTSACRQAAGRSADPRCPARKASRPPGGRYS